MIKKITSLFMLLVLLTGCGTKGFLHYLPESVPPAPFVPQGVELSYISPPNMIFFKNQKLTISNIGSQYFKIAILPSIDMTGEAKYLKNSLADIFYTALFDTKRFSMLDRMEVKRISSIDIKDLTGLTKDTVNGSDVAKEMIQTQKGLLEVSDQKSAKIIRDLQALCDGVMQIYITSNIVAGNESRFGIDYRIVSTINPSSPTVLFAGSKLISYNYNKTTASLSIDRSAINEVAANIKERFPNPNSNIDLKIINKIGKKITINAGKNENIIAGMLGYVIQVKKGLDGNSTIAYRGLFEVREVFSETLNAELLSKNDDEELILNTIKEGEPIKMK